VSKVRATIGLWRLAWRTGGANHHASADVAPTRAVDPTASTVTTTKEDTAGSVGRHDPCRSPEIGSSVAPAIAAAPSHHEGVGDTRILAPSTTPAIATTAGRGNRHESRAHMPTPTPSTTTA